MNTVDPHRRLLVSASLALHSDGLGGVTEAARRAEEQGLDGVSFGEMASDPMLHMTLAAAATDRLDLMTNIVVAFARSPMVLAMQARNIQELSRGRFILGIGSQIKAHIERRFSMPWTAPAARMAEYIAALRAIWDAWATGERLNFRGEFYQHTLMSPAFVPQSNCANPRIYLAAVGEHMTHTAGAVADGLLAHPFTTERYLREVTLPAVERARGNDLKGFDIVHTPFVITGRNDVEYENSRETVRAQIAFYGSTPAYRPVLDLHGWGDLAAELNSLSTSGSADRWSRMAQAVDDEVLDAFAVSGTLDAVGKAVVSRFGDVVSRVEINHIGLPSAELIQDVAHSIDAANE